MLLFEVFLTPGTESRPLLSNDVLEQTGAQVMTVEQAEFVGLEGIPADPEGRPRRLIACKPTDERMVASRLEANADVGAFRVHRLA